MPAIVNGEWRDSLSVDRASAYGDGCFTTMALINGVIENLDLHWQRLTHTCHVLGLSWDGTTQLAHARSLIKIGDSHKSIIKVHISGAASGRGYVRGTESCTVISLHDWPEKPASFYSIGVEAVTCAAPISCNPMLAGLKHLNRLDSVLAAIEVSKQKADEGLLGTAEHVFEATSANLFMLRGDSLITPALSQAGVAGIARARILDFAPSLGLKVAIRPVEWSELQIADALFLSNAVLGCWPIRSVYFNRDLHQTKNTKGRIKLLPPSNVSQTIQASLFPGR